MSGRRWPMQVFRVLFVVNTAWVVVSFVPAYFGTIYSPGLAGTLFPNHSGGLRGDVLWLGLSGLVLLAWSVFAMFRVTDQKNGSNVADAILGLIWAVEYVAYIGHVLGGLWTG